MFNNNHRSRIYYSRRYTTIERKWMLEQACRLYHLSLCLSACLSGGWIVEKRLIGSGYRLVW